MTIAREQADAESWVKAYQDFEDDLVRRGIDTNDTKNYQAFYSKFGAAVPVLTLWDNTANWLEHNEVVMIAPLIVVGSLTIASLLVIRRMRTRRSINSN